MFKDIGKGYVHVYTGDGKGKTTAALGLTLRALGAGYKVLFTQFLKQGDYSEIKALRCFAEQVEVRQFGSGKFVRGKPQQQDIEAASKGLAWIRSTMASNDFDLVVLDEINVAIHFEVISLQGLIEFLESRPQGVEVVLTGRWARPEIIEIADLVTEMKMIKHYYQKGVRARIGVEK